MSIFYCPDRSEFCFPYIYNGAKCKIIETLEYTYRVLFGEEKESCLVSPDYLISSADWNRIKKRNEDSEN